MSLIVYPDDRGGALHLLSDGTLEHWRCSLSASKKAAEALGLEWQPLAEDRARIALGNAWREYLTAYQHN